MAKRISIKLTDKNDWLLEAIEKEKKVQNRPSINNMIETILISYFKKDVTKNKKGIYSKN